ncbi:MAG: hypothetical protein HN547_11560 [Chloroflexi bacterium]|nr:hypothetical protein [Chloroflexota bacterium]
MENEIFDPFEEPKDPRREGKKESLALTFWIFLIILFVFLLSYFNRSSSDNFPTENIISSPTSLLNSNVTNTPNSVNATETALPEIIIAPTSLPATEVPLEGLMVFSIMEAGYFHLFAYEPTSQLFTRLSIGEANDVDPRLSPDGTKIAFSSDRKGQSYIYVLNLLTGETLAVTNDIEHDSRPSWSSDGLWLTFERVEKNNVDIFIQPIDSSIPPIKITFDLHSDFSPTWHPDGKTIAFASSRTGNFDIWTINIEDLGNDGYLQQITSTPQDETNPIWSPSGDLLAWSSTHQGFQSIFISNPQIKEDFIQIIGRGNYTRWDPSGKNLITDIRSPQKDLIAIYKLNEQSQLINSFSPPGNIRGMDWGSNALPTNLPENMQTIADQELSTPWTNIENENMENDFGRYELSAYSSESIQ